MLCASETNGGINSACLIGIINKLNHAVHLEEILPVSNAQEVLAMNINVVFQQPFHCSACFTILQLTSTLTASHQQSHETQEHVKDWQSFSYLISLLTSAPHLAHPHLSPILMPPSFLAFKHTKQISTYKHISPSILSFQIPNLYMSPFYSLTNMFHTFLSQCPIPVSALLTASSRLPHGNK